MAERRSIVRLAVAGLLLIATVFAGCQGPAEVPQDGIPVWETGVYRIEAEPVGSTTASIRVEWVGAQVVVETAVDQAVVVSKIDAATGELLSQQSVDRHEFPWGSDRIMRRGYLAAHFGLDPLLAAKLAVLLGPQWPILSGPAYAGPWGETEVDAEVNGDGWMAFSSAPCQVQCAINGFGSPGTWLRMNGSSQQVLPSLATYGFGDAPIVNFTLTEHANSADSRVVSARPPSPSEVPSQESLCGLAPCEPPQWPARLGWQSKVQTAMSHPAFVSWEVLHPGTVLHEIHVWDGGELSVNGQRLIGEPLTLASFEGTAGGILFEVTTVEPGTIDSHEVVTRWEESAQPAFSYEPPQAIAPFQVVLEAALAAADSTVDDIHRLIYAILPSEPNPDERARTYWAFYMDDPTATIVVAAASTGQVLSLDAPKH